MTITYREYDARAAEAMKDDMVRVFLAVYSAMGIENEFHAEPRFRRQINSHMTVPGWKGILAFQQRELVGYAYGFPLLSTTHWWDGIIHEPEVGFTTETGSRTFAVSEILVLPDHQRQGIATGMHRLLLSNRDEERATLLAESDNAPAQTAYAKWGWRKVNRLHPDWDNVESPTYDVMILPLPG